MSENLLLIQFQRTEEFSEAILHINEIGEDPGNGNKSEIHVKIGMRTFKPRELRILPFNSELILKGELFVYYKFSPPKTLIEMYFEADNIWKKIRILGKIRIILEENPSYPHAAEIIDIAEKLINALKKWNKGDRFPDIEEKIQHLEDRLKQYENVIIVENKKLRRSINDNT